MSNKLDVAIQLLEGVTLHTRSDHISLSAEVARLVYGAVNASKQRIKELEAENAELKRIIAESNEPLLAKHQPCGCVICTCENEDRCGGCGAKHCGTHKVGQVPNPIYSSPVIQEGMQVATVFNVFHEEEFVGSFLQGSFSTREIAQKWIDSQVGNGKFDGELSISPYTLDSLLNASKEVV